MAAEPRASSGTRSWKVRFARTWRPTLEDNRSRPSTGTRPSGPRVLTVWRARSSTPATPARRLTTPRTGDAGGGSPKSTVSSHERRCTPAGNGVDAGGRACALLVADATSLGRGLPAPEQATRHSAAPSAAATTGMPDRRDTRPYDHVHKYRGQNDHVPVPLGRAPVRSAKPSQPWPPHRQSAPRR